MKKIQIGDIKITQEQKYIINQILDSNRITEGKYTRIFENEWANFVGTKYSIMLNSGSSALLSGLLSLKYHQKYNLRDGSKVITSPLTYVATVNSIIHAGFEPVFADVDRDNFSILPESIEELLKKEEDCSLILPVHLMGYVCDMDRINEIARNHDLYVVEDASQAHGSLYKDKKAGSMSLFSSFSFYIAHNIQAGELGALNTNDKEIVKIVKKIKANGRSCDCIECIRPKSGCRKMGDNIDYDPRFTHDMIGFNFKTMDFQTALALDQLKNFEDIYRVRQKNVEILNQGLSKFSDELQLPQYSQDVSYLAYPIIITDNHIKREKLRFDLEKRGIETRTLFGCIPIQQPAYSHLKAKYERRLPNAEFLGKNGFYIGCHQYLKKEDLEYIIDAFENILK